MALPARGTGAGGFDEERALALTTETLNCVEFDGEVKMVRFRRGVVLWPAQTCHSLATGRRGCKPLLVRPSRAWLSKWPRAPGILRCGDRRVVPMRRSSKRGMDAWPQSFLVESEPPKLPTGHGSDVMALGHRGAVAHRTCDLQ